MNTTAIPQNFPTEEETFSENEVKQLEPRFIGLNEVQLTEHQRWMFHSIVEKQSEKLQHRLSNNANLTIHMKEIGKEGKQHEYEIKLRLDMPGKLLTSEKSDWDMETALHKCFNLVEKEMSRN